MVPATATVSVRAAFPGGRDDEEPNSTPIIPLLLSNSFIQRVNYYTASEIWRDGPRLSGFTVYFWSNRRTTESTPDLQRTT